ncbi:molybdopterin-dependent oxidoreductase [Pseudonocardia nigra]|uniref:molybdopterin-dependent oxidoreductase n=1 Tax=Pseudonocardia nigra TaxID=1921578 RepID=UPI001C5DDFA0|nr:molybdopterin-dependent oxidoreductase [Pseudonocardia nigra]
MSRRGALGLVGGGALLVTALSVPQVAGEPIRAAALLLPRGLLYGDGLNDFPVKQDRRRRCHRSRDPPFRSATLATNQVLDPDSLLALGVNGVDTGLGNGYPRPMIVPALPGVHNTKWVGSIEFRAV